MRVIALIFFMIILPGCVTAPKDWMLIDGSRSNAVVVTAYEYKWYEKPQTSTTQREGVAVDACKGWGFSGAKSFGSIMTECVQWDGQGGCNRKRVSARYQCTDE